MTKNIVIVYLILSFLNTNAQSNQLWTLVKSSSKKENNKSTTTKKENNQLVFELNKDLLTQKLSYLNDKNNAIELTIPNSNGNLEVFMVKESSNFEPELQAKYPNIRAYSGVGLTDKKASLYFSACPTGIQTSVFRTETGSEFIQPTDSGSSLYLLYKNQDTDRLPFNCTTDESQLNASFNKTGKLAFNDKIFRTFRLALSCTGEYATYFGGTKAGALAGMNATMTRVNGIFNRDLALKLVIISGDESVIFTDPTTDPYSNEALGASGAWNQELQTTLTNTIKDNGYDIGHLFGRSGGGGNSGCIGCICVNPTATSLGKGSGYTSPSVNDPPEGDRFDIDYVAHEMGHQLGAYHTFSYDIENTGSNIEPGSGSTIMGYAGIALQYDIQKGSDGYFSYKSIEDIQNNLLRKTCQTSTPITNNPPVVNAGIAYSIPKATPFILKGTGSDPDGNTLTYTWEEADIATSTDKGDSFAIATKPNGPLFRSLPPSNDPIRYMPSLNSVLANRLTSPWESVSSIPRTLNFILTARDNAVAGTAQTNSSRTTITVTNTGPFEITSQKIQDISWIPGTKEMITWSENGTKILSGSANVNIKLSIDGGLTFPITLTSNTPNDGNEFITVPNGISSTNCRLLIEPVKNIFYAVNSATFSIGLNTITTCDTFEVASTFVFPKTTTSKNTLTTRRVFIPANTGLISDVNFQVNLSYSNVINPFPEIELELVSPKGTVVKLSRSNCTNNTDISLDLTFDDELGTDIICNVTAQQTIRPFGALSSFNGENQAGTWTFNIYDYDSTSGSGTINSTLLRICSKTQVALSNPKFEIDDFVMYPNPNNGSFNIAFSSKSSSDIKIYVNDLIGRKVFEGIYESDTKFNKNIELHNVFSGLYLITIIDGERKMVKKLIIE